MTKRKTYTDNNGFIRYEDTRKLIVNADHFYTDAKIAEETKDWKVKKHNRNMNTDHDYEGKILARQEQFYND